MRRAKKVLLLFLGAVLFVLMTAMFTSVITERMLPEETVPETMNREAYPYAVTVETELLEMVVKVEMQ